MPTTIADLPAQSPASVDDDDLIPIWDSQAGTGNTRRVRVGDLLDDTVKDGEAASLGALSATSVTTPSASIEALEIVTGVTFPSGAQVTNLLRSALSVAHSDIAAGSVETVTAAVAGALTSDRILVTQDADLPDGMLVQAWASASGQVSVKLFNASGSLISAGTRNITIFIIRTA